MTHEKKNSTNKVPLVRQVRTSHSTQGRDKTCPSDRLTESSVWHEKEEHEPPLSSHSYKCTFQLVKGLWNSSPSPSLRVVTTMIPLVLPPTVTYTVFLPHPCCQSFREVPRARGPLPSVGLCNPLSGGTVWEEVVNTRGGEEDLSRLLQLDQTLQCTDEVPLSESSPFECFNTMLKWL